MGELSSSINNDDIQHENDDEELVKVHHSQKCPVLSLKLATGRVVLAALL